MKSDPSTSLVACLALAATLSAQDPVTFSDLVGSGKPIQFYGFVRLDAYYNSARASSVIIPATVLPEGTAQAKRNDDQFAFDPRLTRIGMKIDGGLYGTHKIRSQIEIDFANFPTGVPESRPAPRIRLAYIDLDSPVWDVRIGQDWDTISPLYPAVNHELLMWNAGNLGDRRGQVRTTYSSGRFAWETALGLTGAINNQDLDVNAGSTFIERDGFDSGTPHVQTRLSFERDATWAGGRTAEVGAWGMFGRLETDTAFAGQTRFDSWVYGVDLSVPLTESLTFRGEGWHGQALGDVRGGIGTTINTTTGTEIKASGGWAELVLQSSDDVKYHLGGTTDDTVRGHLNPGNPDLNWSAYVGTVVDLNPDIRIGFDTIYWETDWLATGIGNMVRFDLYCMMTF